MSLTVTTTSPDEQLTTTAAVARVLGISTGTTDDFALIDELITRASQRAERIVGRPLSAAGYRETLSGFGRRSLMLSRRPVRAVTGFWNATDTGTASTMLSSDYALGRESGVVERDEGFVWDAPQVPSPFSYPLAQGRWGGQEEKPWLVDYVAGYSYDGISTGSDLWSTAKGTTSTGRTLPEDIEDAVIHLTVEMYEGTEGVEQEQVDDLRIRYSSFGKDQPSPAEKRLAPYREVA